MLAESTATRARRDAAELVDVPVVGAGCVDVDTDHLATSTAENPQFAPQPHRVVVLGAPTASDIQSRRVRRQKLLNSPRRT